MCLYIYIYINTYYIYMFEWSGIRQKHHTHIVEYSEQQKKRRICQEPSRDYREPERSTTVPSNIHPPQLTNRIQPRQAPNAGAAVTTPHSVFNWNTKTGGRGKPKIPIPYPVSQCTPHIPFKSKYRVTPKKIILLQRKKCKTKGEPNFPSRYLVKTQENIFISNLPKTQETHNSYPEPCKPKESQGK